MPARAEEPRSDHPKEAAPRDPGDFLPDRYPRLSFPDQDWNRFQDGCRGLGLEAGDARRDVLERLYSHLKGVNEWLNLTRITDARDYLRLHVLDSLTAAPLVEQMTTPEDIVLDLGSGGGYPGLPLMTWLPDRRFVLVDSRRKKTDFLKAAVRLTPCPRAEARCFRGREAAALHPDLHRECSLVVARAAGRGASLLPDAGELLALGGVLMLMKGPNYPAEEAGEFRRACGRSGFDLVEECRVSLGQDGPDRFLVLAVRSREGRR